MAVAYLLAACTVTMFWNVGSRGLLFALLPAIALDLGFSGRQAGMLIVWANAGYMVGVWLSGRVRSRPVPLVVGGIGLALLTLLAIEWVTTYLPLALTVVGVSLGSGLYFPQGMGLIAAASTPATRGRNLSVHELGAAAGLALAYLAAGQFLPLLGWRHTMLAFIGSFGLLSAALMLGLGRRSQSPPPAAAAGAAAEAPAVSQHGPGLGQVVHFAVIATGFFAVIVGLLGILPLWLVSYRGVDPAAAARLVGWARLTGFVTPLLLGALSDRMGRKPVLAAGLLLAAAGLAGMSWLPYGTVFIVCLAGVAGLVTGLPPVAFAAMTETAGRHAVRFTSSTMTVTNLLALLLVPAVLAVLVAEAPPAVTFLFTAAVTSVGGLFALALGRARHNRPRAAVK